MTIDLQGIETVPPDSRAASPLEGMTRDEVLADIARVWDAMMTPTPMRDALQAYQQRQTDEFVAARALTLAIAAGFVTSEVANGEAREVVERVCASCFTVVAAAVIRQMHERLGSAFEPARFALVAYDIAAIIARDPDFACDLDAITASVKAENEAAEKESVA